MLLFTVMNCYSNIWQYYPVFIHPFESFFSLIYPLLARMAEWRWGTGTSLEGFWRKCTFIPPWWARSGSPFCSFSACLSSEWQLRTCGTTSRLTSFAIPSSRDAETCAMTGLFPSPSFATGCCRLFSCPRPRWFTWATLCTDCGPWRKHGRGRKLCCGGSWRWWTWNWQKPGRGSNGKWSSWTRPSWTKLHSGDPCCERMWPMSLLALLLKWPSWQVSTFFMDFNSTHFSSASGILVLMQWTVMSPDQQRRAFSWSSCNASPQFPSSWTFWRSCI